MSGPSPAPMRTPPLWLLCAMPGFSIFASSVYLPSMPAMAQDLAVPIGQVQYTIAVYLASLSICMLVVGAVSDRIGRRPVALTGLSLFWLGSVVAPFIDSLPQLMLARAVQGIGASGGIVLARTIMRDLYDDRQAARANAILAMGVALGPMVAPVVGSSFIAKSFTLRRSVLDRFAGPTPWPCIFLKVVIRSS